MSTKKFASQADLEEKQISWRCPTTPMPTAEGDPTPA